MTTTKQFFIILADSKQYATAEEVSVHLAGLSAEARSKNLVVQGTAFRPSLPRIDLVPLNATSTTKRDKDADAKIASGVLGYLQSNPGTQSSKAVQNALGITGAQMSAAKTTLVKAGTATDPGKGKIAAKAKDAQS